MPGFCWAVRLLVRRAAEVKDVAGDQLLRPQDASGIRVKSHHRVAGLCARLRVVHPGADINGVKFRIDGGRSPERGSGRSPGLDSRTGLAGHLRRFRDGVSPPEPFAGLCVEGREAPAHFTASELGTRRRNRLLAAGNGDVKAVAIQLWRSGNGGVGTFFHVILPQLTLPSPH